MPQPLLLSAAADTEMTAWRTLCPGFSLELSGMMLVEHGTDAAAHLGVVSS